MRDGQAKWRLQVSEPVGLQDGAEGTGPSIHGHRWLGLDLGCMKEDEECRGHFGELCIVALRVIDRGPSSEREVDELPRAFLGGCTAGLSSSRHRTDVASPFASSIGAVVFGAGRWGLAFGAAVLRRRPGERAAFYVTRRACRIFDVFRPSRRAARARPEHVQPVDRAAHGRGSGLGRYGTAPGGRVAAEDGRRGRLIGAWHVLRSGNLCRRTTHDGVGDLL